MTNIAILLLIVCLAGLTGFSMGANIAEALGYSDLVVYVGLGNGSILLAAAIWLCWKITRHHPS